MTDVPRRDVLLSLAGAAVAPMDSVGVVEGADNAIPTPFDAIPTIDEPTENDRRRVKTSYPPRAIPDVGPIPDPTYQDTITEPITVPAWALETVRWKLEDPTDPAEYERHRVEGLLMHHTYIWEDFRTPDGRDAVEVLLAELE